MKASQFFLSKIIGFQNRCSIPVCSAVLMLVTVPALAGNVSPFQSSARPFGLDVVGPVQMARTDAQSTSFMNDALDEVRTLVNANLGEQYAIENVAEISLDPSQLRLEHDAEVRAYFIAEGAGYRNTFGFMTEPYDPESSLTSTDAQLIFPDASSSRNYLETGNTGGQRSNYIPLRVGDFVDLGTLSAGTEITPFLIRNGANGGQDIFTPFPDLNPDGIQHFVSLTLPAIENNPYLVIGIEDQCGGGDNDFNDLVIVLDVGAANVDALNASTVPLPSSVVALIGATIGWAGLSRRRRVDSQPSEETA